MNDETPKPPPRARAVALRYDTTRDDAPRVVAKGQGLIAERIMAIAREHDIHVHADPDLVQLLAALEIEDPVPEHLYRAVAEVLAFVYRLNQAAGR